MIVTFEVDIPFDGALLFEAIAAVIREVENIEDVNSCVPFFSIEKPSTSVAAALPGHGPGCRMGKVTRGEGFSAYAEPCTCGPVPR